eukprot:CAMPEP_0174275386 /NCGR_PEP_ID=MMETSP0439-20130205/59795_1 /TAXON_ID=0 /ORGANISM="Stereomyxa ramosa, Strain Chinc5" /LENGTH=556 /DNA_ID=CAMNT_0015367483 /DNA_START=17 /DNA_END=1687 /DNA_ORIENTATION=-
MAHKLVLVLLLSVVVFCTGKQSTENEYKPHVCFAEGTDPEYMAALTSNLHSERFIQFASSRWSATATQGSSLTIDDPTIITYGFADDNSTINPRIVNESTDPSFLQSFLDGIFGDISVWQPLFQEALDFWSQGTGLTFVWETADDGSPFQQANNFPGVTGVRADIRFFGHSIDGNSGVLGYAFSPNHGDIVLDTDESQSFWQTEAARVNLITHEIGHALNLAHVINQANGLDPFNALMEPVLSTDFLGPQHDDLRGITFLYGDQNEDNDNFDTATEITFEEQITLDRAELGPSSRDAGDMYKITLPGDRDMNVTVIPFGLTYDQREQAVPPTPPSPTPSPSPFEVINSEAIYNLVITVYDENENEVETSNSGGLGQEEQLFVSGLAAGTYFIEISKSNADTEDGQMYDWTISFSESTGGGDGDGDGDGGDGTESIDVVVDVTVAISDDNITCSFKIIFEVESTSGLCSAIETAMDDVVGEQGLSLEYSCVTSERDNTVEVELVIETDEVDAEDLCDLADNGSLAQALEDSGLADNVKVNFNDGSSACSLQYFSGFF